MYTLLEFGTSSGGSGGGRGGVQQHERPSRPAVQRVRVRPEQQRQLQTAARRYGCGEQAARAAVRLVGSGELKTASPERQ